MKISGVRRVPYDSWVEYRIGGERFTPNGSSDIRAVVIHGEGGGAYRTETSAFNV